MSATLPEPVWREIPAEEYVALYKASQQPLSVGAALSDPDGNQFGTPHMLTTWDSADGRPLLRHQCWPDPGRADRGDGHMAGFARPCLSETTLPAEPAPGGEQ